METGGRWHGQVGVAIVASGRWHCRRAPKDVRAGFMLASYGDLSEGYGHGEIGVCLGDGQTEAYLKDMDMTSLAPVCLMARRRPE